VEEGKDKHQEKISLEQDSLGYLEEGITIAVTAPHNTATAMEDTTVDTIMGTTVGITMDTAMEDTTVDTIMVTTVGITMDTTMEVTDTTADTTVGITMDTTMEVTDTTADTAVDQPLLGVSVTTDLYSKTSMVLHMVLAREGMRLARDGATLLGMAVKMQGSHRGSLTTRGHT